MKKEHNKKKKTEIVPKIVVYHIITIKTKNDIIGEHTGRQSPLKIIVGDDEHSINLIFICLSKRRSNVSKHKSQHITTK